MKRIDIVKAFFENAQVSHYKLFSLFRRVEGYDDCMELYCKVARLEGCRSDLNYVVRLAKLENGILYVDDSHVNGYYAYHTVVEVLNYAFKHGIETRVF